MTCIQWAAAERSQQEIFQQFLPVLFVPFNGPTPEQKATILKARKPNLFDSDVLAVDSISNIGSAQVDDTCRSEQENNVSPAFRPCLLSYSSYH